MTFKEWMKKKFDNFKKTRFYAKVKEELRKLFIKLLIISLVVLIVYISIPILYPWLKSLFINFLKGHPTLNALYLHVSYQLLNWTALGLFYQSFFGSIFFLPIPAELTIIQFIAHDYNIFLLIILSTVGGVLGLLFNYFFGLLAGKKILKYLFKEKYEKMQGWVDKYGAFFLFIFAILPSPLEPLCLFYGAVKYPIKKFIIYTAIGRALKVILIYFLIDWIVTVFVPYLKTILPSFLSSLL